MSDAGARGLLDPASPVRGNYEELAANLLKLERTASVVVTSPDPGAGRTSVCLGLGAALAGMGRRAAVVDCNLENAQLHRVLGEPNFVGLTSGFDDGKTLEHYGHEIIPGLLVVPTGPVLLDPSYSRREEGASRTGPAEKQGSRIARRAGGGESPAFTEPPRRLRRGLARRPRFPDSQERRPRDCG